MLVCVGEKSLGISGGIENDTNESSPSTKEAHPHTLPFPFHDRGGEEMELCGLVTTPGMG